MLPTLKSLRASLRPALFITGLLLGAAVLVFSICYRRAAAALDNRQLEARNATGVTIHAQPKRYVVGQSLTRQTVIEHLTTLNYALATPEQPDAPGSYTLVGRDKLRLTPRATSLPPVQMTFTGSRLTALVAAGQPVPETTVEAEVITTAIKVIDGEKASVMNVRRLVVQSAEVLDTHLYFAAIASEDQSFPDHHGLNYPAYLRLPYYKLRGWRTGGASSITAQTCKNAILQDKTQNAARKWNEMLCALVLEERLDKPSIFTLYANSVFLGGTSDSPNVYGFRAAAQQYFAKDQLRELSLAEAATLVAMLPKPNDFLKAAQRGDYAELTLWRNRVLRLLGEVYADKYAPAVIQAAQSEPVHFVSSPANAEPPLDKITRGYQAVLKTEPLMAQLKALSPQEMTGADISSTLDADLQRAATRVLSERLPALERQFPPASPQDCGGQPEKLVGVIVALNPQTGEVIAFYGGAGGPEGYLTEASATRNAMCSTFKPFVVTANLAAGRFHAASVIDGSQTRIDGWQPTQGVCGAGRVRSLLAASCDDFATYALAQMGGPKAGAELFEKLMGQHINQPAPVLALGFGETEITALQMARAYGAYANGGLVVTPTLLSRVYLDGQEVAVPQSDAPRVLDAGAAYVTVQMLRSVVGYGPDGTRGTAAQAFRATGLRLDEVEMAAKTGSGPHGVWLMSVSPQLVVAVSVTYRCHSTIKNSDKLFAAQTAGPLWAEFMREVKQHRPDLLAGRFTQPSQVVKAQIDAQKGCRRETGRGVEEYFLAGHEAAPCDVSEEPLHKPEGRGYGGK